MKKTFGYWHGYMAGTVTAWRKKYTIKYFFGYMAGKFGF
jgi:hypothetical protein